MRFSLSFIFALLLLIFSGVAGCKPKKLENGRAVAEEVERRTVKRFTEKQILAEALRVGDSLTHLADSLAQSRLMTGLSQGSLAEALQHYPPETYPEVQALAQKYGATPGRQGRQSLLSHKKAEVRRLNNRQLLYTRPIYITHTTCLPCHGKTIAADNLQVLKSKKPSWRPGGLQVGDWAGAWVIPFQRKAILDAMTLKGMKKKPKQRQE